MLLTTTPIVLVRCVTRLRATALATYFCFCAILRTRAAVLAFTSGLLRSALDTDECDTPAARAMSLMEIISGSSSRKTRVTPQKNAANGQGCKRRRRQQR